MSQHFLQFGSSFWLWYIMNWSTSLSRVIRHIRKHTVPNKTNNRKKTKTKITTTTTTTKKNSCPSISTLEASCVFLGDALRSYRSAISLHYLPSEIIRLYGFDQNGVGRSDGRILVKVVERSYEEAGGVGSRSGVRQVFWMRLITEINLGKIWDKYF